MNTFEIASIGLRDDIERLRLHSHNIANLTTPGYKRQVAVAPAFSGVFDAERSSRAGVEARTVLSAGGLRASGGPLDVALNERDFLMVRTPDGDTALIRGGPLHVDANGQLVTSAGLPVQGSTGEIQVPVVATSVRIDTRGRVLADDRPVGTLALANLNPGARPMSIGEGMFKAASPGDVRPADPIEVHPGHTEVSNVVPAHEMVQVMATMRHAEAMARLIQGADEMLDKAIRKMGDIS